jgi:hypothetical protein
LPDQRVQLADRSGHEARCIFGPTFGSGSKLAGLFEDKSGQGSVGERPLPVPTDALGADAEVLCGLTVTSREGQGQHLGGALSVELGGWHWFCSSRPEPHADPTDQDDSREQGEDLDHRQERLSRVQLQPGRRWPVQPRPCGAASVVGNAGVHGPGTRGPDSVVLAWFVTSISFIIKLERHPHAERLALLTRGVGLEGQALAVPTREAWTAPWFRHLPLTPTPDTGADRLGELEGEADHAGSP